MKFKTLTISLIALSTLAPQLVQAQAVSYASLYPDMVFDTPERPATCDQGPSNLRLNIGLEENNIVLVNDVSEAQLNQFLFEFAKFPSELNEEMIRRGAITHLIAGSGVTADPAWVPSNVKTFDGRPWSEVPGAGGNNMIHNPAVPTMVVANHLYSNHGSVNLVLHERAHGLDNLYIPEGISKSKAWNDLMTSNPSVKNFLATICTAGYCDGHESEGFAELFAYHNACRATRDDLAKKFPEVANFLNDLDNTEELLIKEGRLAKPARELEQDLIDLNHSIEQAQIQYEKDLAAYNAHPSVIRRREREAREAAEAEQRRNRQERPSRPQPETPVSVEPAQVERIVPVEQAPKVDEGPSVVDQIVGTITSEETKERVSATTSAVVEQTKETAGHALDFLGRGVNNLRGRLFGGRSKGN